MTKQFDDFKKMVWDYYAAARRDLPWRVPEKDGSFDPYKIMVSEIMLQQTQVPRVIQKYHSFLKRFPTVRQLSEASLSDVLGEWSGLGYNRRAKFLLEAAKLIGSSETPQTHEAFSKLPGIGQNTAAAVCVYTYNQPHVFIETNIRTVYIHHFFKDETKVDDKSISKIVGQTLDTYNPREWYWALMDYGSYLKKTSGNVSRKSKHYAKQPTFKGSKRELRAKVLRVLLEQNLTEEDLAKKVKDERLQDVLNDLKKESMILRKNNRYQIA